VKIAAAARCDLRKELNEAGFVMMCMGAVMDEAFAGCVAWATGDGAGA
jgi:hypothetical protein